MKIQMDKPVKNNKLAVKWYIYYLKYTNNNNN